MILINTISSLLKNNLLSFVCTLGFWQKEDRLFPLFFNYLLQTSALMHIFKEILFIKIF